MIVFCDMRLRDQPGTLCCSCPPDLDAYETILEAYDVQPRRIRTRIARRVSVDAICFNQATQRHTLPMYLASTGHAYTSPIHTRHAMVLRDPSHAVRPHVPLPAIPHICLTLCCFGPHVPAA